MILSIFKKKPNQTAVHNIYGIIVAQSRQPKFYADWHVPDSVTGRFDMVSLHLCLLLRRLKTSDAADREFSQNLFDWFFKDMDRSLREMGAADTVVPKRIQKMGELFYGMLASIGEALDNKDKAALCQVLVRNIYADAEPESIESMVNYVLDLEQELNAQQPATILKGVLTMKEPA